MPAASALAADLDPLPPPPPPVVELRAATYDWSGAYAGGWVGIACIDGTLTDNTNVAPLPQFFNNAGCGYKGGVTFGYNHQMDNIVFGAEADWGMSSAIVRNREAGGMYDFSLNSIATVRGRVGYAIDDTLLFLTAGGAWARGNLNSVAGGPAVNLQQDHFGWTVGGGIEQALTDSVRIKLDYLYTQLSDGKYSSPCAACNVDVHWGGEHEVRVGVNYAF